MPTSVALNGVGAELPLITVGRPTMATETCVKITQLLQLQRPREEKTRIPKEVFAHQIVFSCSLGNVEVTFFADLHLVASFNLIAKSERGIAEEGRNTYEREASDGNCQVRANVSGHVVTRFICYPPTNSRKD